MRPTASHRARRAVPARLHASTHRSRMAKHPKDPPRHRPTPHTVRVDARKSSSKKSWMTLATSPRRPLPAIVNDPRPRQETTTGLKTFRSLSACTVPTSACTRSHPRAKWITMRSSPPFASRFDIIRRTTTRAKSTPSSWITFPGFRCSCATCFKMPVVPPALGAGWKGPSICQPTCPVWRRC